MPTQIQSALPPGPAGTTGAEPDANGVLQYHDASGKILGPAPEGGEATFHTGIGGPSPEPADSDQPSTPVTQAQPTAPQPTIDYAALAKQAGAIASTPTTTQQTSTQPTIDYAALAKQAGAIASTPTAAPQAAPAEDTGVWAGIKRNTVGMVAGLYHAAHDPATSAEKGDLLRKIDEENKRAGTQDPKNPNHIDEDLAINPSKATLAWHRLMDAPADQLNAKADTELTAGKELWDSQHKWKGANTYLSGAVDKVLSDIPMAGPFINSIAERAERGDISGALTDIGAVEAYGRATDLIKTRVGNVVGGEFRPTGGPEGPATQFGKSPVDQYSPLGQQVADASRAVGTTAGELTAKIPDAANAVGRGVIKAPAAAVEGAAGLLSKIMPESVNTAGEGYPARAETLLDRAQKPLSKSYAAKQTAALPDLASIAREQEALGKPIDTPRAAEGAINNRISRLQNYIRDSVKPEIQSGMDSGGLKIPFDADHIDEAIDTSLKGRFTPDEIEVAKQKIRDITPKEENGSKVQARDAAIESANEELSAAQETEDSARIRDARAALEDAENTDVTNASGSLDDIEKFRERLNKDSAWGAKTTGSHSIDVQATRAAANALRDQLYGTEDGSPAGRYKSVYDRVAPGSDVDVRGIRRQMGNLQAVRDNLSRAITRAEATGDWSPVKDIISIRGGALAGAGEFIAGPIGAAVGASVNIAHDFVTSKNPNLNVEYAFKHLSKSNLPEPKYGAPDVKATTPPVPNLGPTSFGTGPDTMAPTMSDEAAAAHDAQTGLGANTRFSSTSPTSDTAPQIPAAVKAEQVGDVPNFSIEAEPGQLEGSRVISVFHGDKGVGAVMLVPDHPEASTPGGNAHIQLSGVADAYQKHGLGTLLYKRAIDEAKKAGYDTVSSGSVTSEPAQKLWDGLVKSGQYDIRVSDNPAAGSGIEEPKYTINLNTPRPAGGFAQRLSNQSRGGRATPPAGLDVSALQNAERPEGRFARAVAAGSKPVPVETDLTDEFNAHTAEAGKYKISDEARALEGQPKNPDVQRQQTEETAEPLGDKFKNALRSARQNGTPLARKMADAYIKDGEFEKNPASVLNEVPEAGQKGQILKALQRAYLADMKDRTLAETLSKLLARQPVKMSEATGLGDSLTGEPKAAVA